MEDYLIALENELRSIVTAPHSIYAAYYGMLQYHLGWTDTKFVPTKTDTGKRIRPLICLLACEAVGADWRRALPIATAIELVHNFSLIHDDIEDSSDERRGRPAVWKVWGLAQGLNAGDGMFLLSRLALDRMALSGTPTEKCSQINLEFDETTLALCQGQFLDISFEARLDVTLDEYLQMIHGKTAALISASTKLGALVGTDDQSVIDAFAQFGKNIGLAFQIADDILGVWGDPSVTGKSAATDILSKKKAYPAIMGLSHPQYSAALREIYSQSELSSEDVKRALEIFDAIDTRAQAQARADHFRATALDALAATQLDNAAIQRLREIAQSMTRRVR